MKLTAKNASKIDLATLGETDLRTLCKNLTQAYEHQKERLDLCRKMTEKQAKVSIRMLPEVATLLEAMAERAGFLQEPEVRRAIEALRDQAHVQWSKDVQTGFDPPHDAHPSETGTEGDAEMVLQAPLAERILSLQDSMMYEAIPEHVRTRVADPVNAIESELRTAIQTGFKKQGLPSHLDSEVGLATKQRDRRHYLPPPSSPRWKKDSTLLLRRAGWASGCSGPICVPECIAGS